MISSPAVERVGCVDIGGDIPAVVRRLQWSAFNVGMFAPSNGEFAASGDYWRRSCSSGSFACRTVRSARHSAVMGHQVAGRTATTVRRSFQWTGPGKNSERRRCPGREGRRHRALACLSGERRPEMDDPPRVSTRPQCTEAGGPCSKAVLCTRRRGTDTQSLKLWKQRTQQSSNMIW